MRRSPAMLALPLLLAVAACGGPEPYERPGTWRATGANEANLRAMVVEPAHLTRGARPLAASHGERAAIAAERLGRGAAPQAAPTGGAGAGQGMPAAAPQGGLPPLPPPYGGSNGRR
ncbi:hypothetical protein [Falsiroseomonas sp.]|uniref:hypothetical protein n=1 Tax=Falsiroseomonas sp. TaxID=2870721 RepID=UPI00356B5F5A